MEHHSTTESHLPTAASSRILGQVSILRLTSSPDARCVLMPAGQRAERLHSELILSHTKAVESAVLADCKGTTPAYKTKIRQLYVNLKDKNNPGLRESVVSGELAAQRFARQQWFAARRSRLHAPGPRSGQLNSPSSLFSLFGWFKNQHGFLALCYFYISRSMTRTIFRARICINTLR